MSEAFFLLEKKLSSGHKPEYARVAVSTFRQFTRMLSPEDEENMEVWKTATDADLIGTLDKKRGMIKSESAFFAFRCRVRQCVASLFDDCHEKWPTFMKRGCTSNPSNSAIPVEVAKLPAGSPVRSFFKTLSMELKRHTEISAFTTQQSALSFLYGFLFSGPDSLLWQKEVPDKNAIVAALKLYDRESLCQAYHRYHEKGRVKMAVSLATLGRHLFLINVLFCDMLKVISKKLQTDDFGIFRRKKQTKKRAVSDVASSDASTGTTVSRFSLDSLADEKPQMDMSSSWVCDPKPSGGIHVFTPSEVKSLYLAADKLIEKLLLVALFSTGMRTSGFCKIKVQGAFTVGPHGVKMSESFQTTEKGEIPVSYKCCSVLATLLSEWISSGNHGDKWMFPGASGSERLHRRHAYDVFMSIAKRAGMGGSHVHPHTTRHTVIWTLWALDNPIDKIAKVAHHQSTSTTEIYIRPTGAEIANTVDMPWAPCDGDNISNQDKARELSIAMASPYASADGKTFPTTLNFRAPVAVQGRSERRVHFRTTEPEASSSRPLSVQFDGAVPSADAVTHDAVNEMAIQRAERRAVEKANKKRRKEERKEESLAILRMVMSGGEMPPNM